LSSRARARPPIRLPDPRHPARLLPALRAGFHPAPRAGAGRFGAPKRPPRRERSLPMRSTGTFVNGFLLGAGLVYLFDPDRGARRRALVRDRIGRTGRKAGEALETTARDLRNRSVGAVAEIRAAVRTRRDREAVPDEVLAERVRSAIGRVVSHPGAITVTASEGRVTLGGRVLAGEVDRLLARAARVRGVEDLVNELEVHAEPNNVPDLQGG